MSCGIEDYYIDKLKWNKILEQGGLKSQDRRLSEASHHNYQGVLECIKWFFLSAQRNELRQFIKIYSGVCPHMEFGEYSLEEYLFQYLN